MGSPGSITITRTVNSSGNITSETNGRQLTTDYDYDGLNRLTGITTPRTDDSDIVIDWGFFSDRSRILSRGNFVEQQELDGFGRTIRIEVEGIVKTFEYDVMGRKVFESDPAYTTASINGSRFEYDALNRLIRLEHTVDGSDVVYEYPAFSGGGLGLVDPNTVKITNERGISTVYTYRSFSDPNQSELVKIDSPENTITEIERYPFGTVRSVRQRASDDSVNQLRLFVLNDRHQQRFAQHPEASFYEFTYDAVGNQTGVKNGYTSNIGGNQTSFESTVIYNYDDLYRLENIDYPINNFDTSFFPRDAEDISYEYDNNGNVTKATKGNAIWDYVYDDNDNLKKETLSLGADQYEIEYGYNTLDALSEVTYPSGLAVEYQPNDLGWPTLASGFATLVQYHPTGHINTIQYNNGVTNTITQNPRLFTESITSSNQAINLTYGYEDNGNVASVTDAVTPANTLSLTYDGIDRLRTAGGSWGSGLVTYDAMGNIRNKQIGDVDLNYIYGTDSEQGLLKSITGSLDRSYSYDAQGNAIPLTAVVIDPVTTIHIQNYIYNQANQLVETATRNAWRYDANNRRVMAFAVGNEARPKNITLYNSAGQLLYEVNNRHCVERDYIRLGSTLIAQRDQEMLQDADGDLIPDCNELNADLNPDNSADAAGDADGDGLSNLNEYQINTDINNEDTDGDQISDGYEANNQLDPLSDDANEDRDGDGYTNLQEFEAGTSANDVADVPTTVPGESPWGSSDITGAIKSSVAIAGDGTLYVGSNDNRVYSYNPDGTLRWFYETGGDVLAAPVIGNDGTIYMGSLDNTFYALNPDGTLRWRYTTTNDIRAAAAMSLDGSVIYFGSRDELLYAFNADGSPDANSDGVPDTPLWSLDIVN